MATSCSLEAHEDGKGTSKVTGSASLADVTVNTSPNSSGGWNTATVTADKQRNFYLGTTAANAAGMPAGWYEAVGGGVFRKTR